MVFWSGHQVVQQQRQRRHDDNPKRLDAHLTRLGMCGIYLYIAAEEGARHTLVQSARHELDARDVEQVLQVRLVFEHCLEHRLGFCRRSEDSIT